MPISMRSSLLARRASCCRSRAMARMSPTSRRASPCVRRKAAGRTVASGSSPSRRKRPEACSGLAATPARASVSLVWPGARRIWQPISARKRTAVRTETTPIPIASRDLDGLRAEAEAARRDGFTAKMAIHPAQVPVINAVFTPGEEAQARARKIVAYFAANPDSGVTAIDGEMIDRPHLRQAERLLARVGRAPVLA
jgi:hypothetical protein